MKAVETLLLSDGLCLSLALSGATTVSLQSEGREDEREWRREGSRGRGEVRGSSGGCTTSRLQTTSDVQKLILGANIDTAAA